MPNSVLTTNKLYLSRDTPQCFNLWFLSSKTYVISFQISSESRESIWPAASRLQVRAVASCLAPIPVNSDSLTHFDILIGFKLSAWLLFPTHLHEIWFKKHRKERCCFWLRSWELILRLLGWFGVIWGDLLRFYVFFAFFFSWSCDYTLVDFLNVGFRLLGFRLE